MKRVLYFTGYRMVAQEWLGRELQSSVYFEPDEQGLELFTSYLSSINKEPVYLLVDLIEEEFRRITIPHLRGNDRKELIERNYKKFFRTSEYRCAISQGVTKAEKRKEEKVLFMGLTNQYLLKPWLEIIHSTTTPLIGIVSLPLLTEDLLPTLKSENDCVILVSQQVPSNLRQSVYLRGKLILSRLVPIASFYHGNYADDVIRDIQNTERYLISQRLIDRMDKISVEILCNERHLEKLTLKSDEDDVYDYQIHDINKLMENEKIAVADKQDFSSMLFCYQLTRKAKRNHYASSGDLKYLRHYIGSLALKIASVAMIAISLALMATSVAKGMFFDATVNEMRLVEQKYKTKFNQLSENRIDSTTSTSNMQGVVQAVEDIEANYQFRPNELMALISQDISLFDALRVKELEWFIAKSEEAEQAIDVNWDQKGGARQSRNRNKSNSKDLFEILIVKGEFLKFDGNYRFVLSAISDLEDAMRISGHYDSIKIIKRPLDIEAENQLMGDVSANTKKSNEKAEFAIRVVRKVKKNEK